MCIYIYIYIYIYMLNAASTSNKLTESTKSCKY